jgi:hypothetical protein
LNFALLPDVARQLAHVLGQRRRSIDLEVRDDLRAQRLAEHDDTLDVPVLRNIGLQARVLEAFRTDPQDDLTADVALDAGALLDDLVSERDRLAPDKSDERVAPALDGRLDQVHRRRADESADEEIDRPLVQLLRRRHLLDLPLAHDCDAVAHRHRLDLVVCDINRRHAEVVLDARDLGAHVDSELRVQVRERLVHEIRLWLADDRSAHRHALALPTRERTRLSVEELLEAEDARSFADALFDFVLGHLSQPEPERDVLVHREVGVERVALEDHGDVAISCGHVVDDAVADLDDAFADLLEACDHAQRRCLAAAGGADEDHELAVGDLEVHVAHGTRAARIDLADVTERHARQMFLPG